MRFRSSELVLLAFFSYILAITPFFPDRRHLKGQPALVLAAIAGLIVALAMLDRGRTAKTVSVVRDWLPLALTFAAFREMELFLPAHFDHHYEQQWIRWDVLLLHDWHLRAVIEAWGWPVPLYLEVCYLLVYGVGAYGVAMLYGCGKRSNVDRFLTIYLLGTLGAYALFPYFPSEPPRYVFPHVELPEVVTWARELNLFLLKRATIHSGVFPSAHVSAAFSTAWAMFVTLPKRKLLSYGVLLYALSVSVATIYGRYHYTADVGAGFGVSLCAALYGVAVRRRAGRSVGAIDMRSAR